MFRLKPGKRKNKMHWSNYYFQFSLSPWPAIFLFVFCVDYFTKRSLDLFLFFCVFCWLVCFYFRPVYEYCFFSYCFVIKSDSHFFFLVVGHFRWLNTLNCFWSRFLERACVRDALQTFAGRRWFSDAIMVDLFCFGTWAQCIKLKSWKC